MAGFNPKVATTATNLFAASRAASTPVAPVTTTLPVGNRSPVACGSRILITCSFSAGCVTGPLSGQRRTVVVVVVDDVAAVDSRINSSRQNLGRGHMPCTKKCTRMQKTYLTTVVAASTREQKPCERYQLRTCDALHTTGVPQRAPCTPTTTA